jgi:hypothetical protein
MTYIPAILASNLGRDTDYPDCGVSWFSPCRQNFGIVCEPYIMPWTFPIRYAPSLNNLQINKYIVSRQAVRRVFQAELESSSKRVFNSASHTK